MTELFDTHAHFEGGDEATAAALARAATAGVTRLMAVGGSPALRLVLYGLFSFSISAVGAPSCSGCT